MPTSAQVKGAARSASASVDDDVIAVDGMSSSAAATPMTSLDPRQTVATFSTSPAHVTGGRRLHSGHPARSLEAGARQTGGRAVSHEAVAHLQSIFICGRLPDLAGPEVVRIGDLDFGGYVRRHGEQPSHVMQLMTAEWPMPPIIVHRNTFQVLDGAHRVQAAINKGMNCIEATFYEGSSELAFVVAVAANITTGGLPPTIADRRAAASRILREHGCWSDRAVAQATGLSARTIREIRQASQHHSHSQSRIGRDGRVRPLSTADGRRLAARYLTADPSRSLRSIATCTGISPATVRDVRDRLHRGEGPVPSSGGGTDNTKGPSTPRPIPPRDVKPILSAIAKDPALRLSGPGRDFLRWLQNHAVNDIDGSEIVEHVPEDCLGNIVELARRCSANWAWISHNLAHRGLQRSAPSADLAAPNVAGALWP